MGPWGEEGSPVAEDLMWDGGDFPRRFTPQPHQILILL